jgi:hypothetical protein
MMSSVASDDGGDITDITSGSEYKKMNISFPQSLTLLCNTDGVPVFNSSNTSLWPVYFMINELPVYLRRVHMLLAALWIGTSKPQIESLFAPVVESLQRLSTDGLSWLSEGKLINTRFFVSLISCDSVARPLLQNMKQFNGQYGCSYCLHEGKTVPKGRGFARVYTQEFHDSFSERTHNGMLADAEAAVNTNACVNGVKGHSILSVLSNFDMVRCFFPDYMHAVLLGVVRQFVFLWFDSTQHLKPHYLGRNINEIDTILTSIKPPSEIKRMPRSIEQRKYWKASEWRNFLLFYSVVCIKHFLPKQFLQHWFLLVFSINKLLMTPICVDDIAIVDMALHKFVVLTKDLYGEECNTYNVHLLTHLASYTERWGPLWSNSAFVFEDCNGKLLTFFHGTRGVANQIFRAFAGASQLKLLARRYITEINCADIFMQLTTVASMCKTACNLTCDVTVLGHPVKRSLTMQELVALENLLGSSHILSHGIDVYQRVIVRGKLMHSEFYSEGLKTQDCYISVDGIVSPLLVICICVMQVCHQLSCATHKPVDECVLFCYRVNQSALKNVDNDLSVNLTAHVLTGTVGELVAVWGKHFRHKVFMLSDKDGQMHYITLPPFDIE